jgi:endonuclease YncB( thermonuclease family)
MGSPAALRYPRLRRRWRRTPRPPRSLWRSLLDLAVFAAAATLILLGVRVFNQVTVPAGNVNVIDGDSFRRGKDEIRLNGIDAPEYHQTCRNESGSDWDCGKEAARALRGLVAGHMVACKRLDVDRYHRLVSTCEVGDLVLNAEMVRLGWAIAYRRHGNLYLKEEEEARNARRGIWRGTFDLPEDWREMHRSGTSD